jgi:glycerol-3-phosphate dehydrogenase
MVGTTEHTYLGNPADVTPLPEEIAYLLETWNDYFNDKLVREDIIEAFAGLRVLPKSEQEAFSRSRDTIIHCDNPQAPAIISIYGGKLTSHRATAENVMRYVHRKIPPQQRVNTRVLSLPDTSV